MDALMRRSRGPRGVREFGVAWIGTATVLLTCAGADAAAIRHHDAADHAVATAFPGIPAAEVSVFREWSRYLRAGPEAWAKVEHPPWTAAVKAAAWAGIEKEPGPSDPMVNFLLWKQSIDPTRFAYYHHKLAPALHRIAMSRTTAATVPTVGPSTSGSIGGASGPPAITPISEPQTLNPPPVPEPSMLLLAAGMTAWLARRMLVRPRD
jgi:hypothetical protein